MHARTIVGAVLLLASITAATPRVEAQPELTRRQAQAELDGLRRAEGRETADLVGRLASRNPYEVFLAVGRLAERRASVPRAALVRLVELLDDRTDRVDRPCLELLAAGDPLAHGPAGEGPVNAYPAELHRCRARRWPTTALRAADLLAEQPDQSAVAELLVARVLAHPESAGALAVAAGRCRDLASRVARALDEDHAAAAVDGLVRLALETGTAAPRDVRALAQRFTAEPPSTRAARLAAAVLRWTDGAHDEHASLRDRAVSVLKDVLDPAALQDLEHIGPAARPLVPEVLRRMQRAGAAELPGLVRVLGAVGPDAAAALPVLFPLLRRSSGQDAVVDAVARIGRGSTQARAALAALAGRPQRLADVAGAIADADLILAASERGRLERVFDRTCGAESRRMARRYGEAADWSPPTCEEARSRLDAIARRAMP